MSIENKKARFDYEFSEELEAGIVLTGAETKSYFEKRVTLNGSYAKVIDHELYLVNASFSHTTVPVATQTRSRKLLIRKRELIAIESKMKSNKLTIVPIEMYTKGRLIKVKLGIGRTKREFMKKDKRKARDISLDVERENRAKLS